VLFSFDYRFSKYAHKYIKDYQKTEAHCNNLSFFDKIQEQKEEVSKRNEVSYGRETRRPPQAAP
jgi:hypothetical protein